MTSSSTAYTPLETLLLFQALRAEGISSHSVFNHVSDQLKHISAITSDPKFDAGRLSPDALRELYLWLLKEEVKRDLERQLEREAPLTNGAISPGSRKRKVSSPKLPTVHEAAQHVHLIPQLVTRLYARYRDHAVREVRTQECRHDALKRDVDEIREGKWDERLQKQRTASVSQSPKPSTFAHTQAQSGKQHHATPAQQSTASPQPQSVVLEGSYDGQARRFTENKIDSLINHEPEKAVAAAAEPNRATPSTALPPLSEMAPQSPHFGIPPKLSGPATTQAPGYAYRHASPADRQSPFMSHHAHPLPGSMANSHAHNSIARPSSSPRPVLPPPHGMRLQAQSPVPQGQQPSFHGSPMAPQQYYAQQQQHRMSNGQHELSTPGYYPQHVHQPHPGYYQPQPYVAYPSSHQQHVPAGYNPHANQLGGRQLTPFTVEPNEQSRGGSAQSFASQHQQHQTHSSQHQPSRSHTSQSRHGSSSAPSTALKVARAPSSRLVSDIISALATPTRTPTTPVWKRERRPPPIKFPAPVPKPDIEPMSPPAKHSEPVEDTSRRPSDEVPAKHKPSADLEVTSRTRQGRTKRDRTPLSVAPSTVNGSANGTRSNSVSTAAEALSTSDQRQRSVDEVKAEPATPAAASEEARSAQDVQSGTRLTRKRRGTLQSQLPPPSKRRRQTSLSATDTHDDQDAASPHPLSNTILATRNFHKTAATILNDLNSHKHASYFANPVREKDAPGYSEIIKQPQNLKSIRAAITAGTRAVTAAAASFESPTISGTPTGSIVKPGKDTTIELENSADLRPPKAIVNGVQLEKEVMRVFANAVMFNPGEDGMVSDTREIFEDVEAKIQEWRGVEKDTGEVDEEEGKAKRRKL